MTTSRWLPLVLSLIVIIGVIVYVQRLTPTRGPSLGQSAALNLPSSMATEEKAGQFEPARELAQPSGFINTQPLTIKELIGKKVILVDFWTYSCINCQRTLPYLTSWYEKYKDQGLEIIGIHTPEFDFEKKYDNVVRATTQYGITYPVVLDNDYGTWSAYSNRYWPHKYLIDIDGYVVYDHIGEGGYAETEQKIQELLAERQARLGEATALSTGLVAPTGTEAIADNQPRSPELYFGSARNTYLGNGQSGQPGLQTFSQPKGVKTNILYLVGQWDLRPEYGQAMTAGAKIIFRYQAQKVFMVARSDKPVTVKILRDGQPLGSIAGQDVAADGTVTVQEDRLYRLIEATAWGEHTIEIIVPQPGLQMFTFTFG